MIDIEKLSHAEQLSLIERLWESVSQAPEAIGLTPAQRNELDHRLAALEQDGPTGIPADTFLDSLQPSSRSSSLLKTH
jgi:putative addiction module component (TIGR02574 family)